MNGKDGLPVRMRPFPDDDGSGLILFVISVAFLLMFLMKACS